MHSDRVGAGLSRRSLVRVLLLGSAGTLLAACAPAPAAQPTVAPKPAPPTAAPVATSKPAPSPAASPAAAASPSTASASPSAVASSADIQRLVAAARQEGTLVIAGPPGDSYRNVLATAFEKAYPGISVQYSGAIGRDTVARIQSERAGGQYLVDLHVGGAETPNFQLKPQGVLDPIRPTLILPEVLDGSKWLNGFDAGFMDKEKQFVYAFGGSLAGQVWVNRELVSEAELSKVEQLIDPKWKGKITWDDPRAAGFGSGNLGHLLMVLGEDWVKQFVRQDLVISKDNRQLVESLVRGRTPIGSGSDTALLASFQREGVGQKVVTLDRDSEAGGRVSPILGNVMLINRAPHPNALRLFVNWLLSKDGQTAWVASTGQNSRRLDVDGPKDTAPDPKRTYRVVNSEEYNHFINRAQELAREALA